MIWMTFIRILKNTFKIKGKILVVFDYMISDMLSNKNLNQ